MGIIISETLSRLIPLGLMNYKTLLLLFALSCLVSFIRPQGEMNGLTEGDFTSELELEFEAEEGEVTEGAGGEGGDFGIEEMDWGKEAVNVEENWENVHV